MKLNSQEAKAKNIHVVTDFVPVEVPNTNNWFTNETYKDFFETGTRKLNYSNPDLLTALTVSCSAPHFNIFSRV